MLAFGLGTLPIERFLIDDSYNAQSLTPALSRRERVSVDLIH